MNKKQKILIIERGWAGHFCCSDRCKFRRNTLVSLGNIRIVVSTVGLMYLDNKNEPEEIGINRHYETMCFHAEFDQNKYWDANVSRQVTFESNWALSDPNMDNEANDMHEVVVKEIVSRLRKGDKFLN